MVTSGIAVGDGTAVLPFWKLKEVVSMMAVQEKDLDFAKSSLRFYIHKATGCLILTSGQNRAKILIGAKFATLSPQEETALRPRRGTATSGVNLTGQLPVEVTPRDNGNPKLPWKFGKEMRLPIGVRFLTSWKPEAATK
jgi:hypothetical protein